MSGVGAAGLVSGECEQTQAGSSGPVQRFQTYGPEQERDRCSPCIKVSKLGQRHVAIVSSEFQQNYEVSMILMMEGGDDVIF